MYSILEYSWMINDRRRSDAYLEALRLADGRDKVVLDIGTGSGVFALAACRMGARKVYAVEPDDVIIVAKANAAASGMSDKIEFIQDLSTNVTLPEKAQIIISDLRGALPLYQHHIPSIIDARERHLAPGGILIPNLDRIWAAVVGSEKLYENYSQLWIDDELSIDTSAARQFAVNTRSNTKTEKQDILLPGQLLATLDYHEINGPNVQKELEWTANQPGTAYGLVVWFDTELLGDIGFSNAPDHPALIYRQLFLPFEDPVKIDIRDQLRVQIKANLTGRDYVWRWKTTAFAQGHNEILKADYQQSSFFSAPKLPSLLRKKADIFVPKLNENGQVVRLVINLMNEDVPLGEIANCVAEAFPEIFPSWEAALARVGNLSQKYSQ